MIQRLKLFSTVILFLTIYKANAQEAQVSLLDDISYVYVEKLIAVAKENYPRVKAHDSRIAIADAAVKIAKLSWLSPLSLSYVYSPAVTLNVNNPTFFSGYQIGFQMNIGTILQNPANIKRAKEERKIEYLNRDEYYLSLVTEVKTRYFDYLQSLKNLKLNSQSLIDAQSLLTMMKYKFDKAEVSLQEYSLASTASATANQAKIESEANLLKAKALLEELLGVRLEEVH
jgi:outer membrane protein TolC